MTHPLNKPIMVGETGAPPDYQAQYLGEAQSELKTQFPLVKGFEYYDSDCYSGTCTDLLTTTPWPGQQLSGIAAFATMGADPYFGYTGGG